MNKQPKQSPNAKRVARFLKQHETSYRALISLLIRQVEREIRDEVEQRTPPVEHTPTEDRKDGV